jgi:hypothetical protein
MPALPMSLARHRPLHIALFFRNRRSAYVSRNACVQGCGGQCRRLREHHSAASQGFAVVVSASKQCGACRLVVMVPGYSAEPYCSNSESRFLLPRGAECTRV